MREYVELSCVPANENCQQVGTDSYDPTLARQECRQFIHQLRRQFGEEPGSAQLIIKSNPHDFGSYLEVACYFDDNDEQAAEYAYNLEANLPLEWDDLAREKINLYYEQTKTGIHLPIM